MKKGVKKPGKNRKRRFDAPDHIKRKLVSASLAPPLKAQYGVRSMPVRRGDTVTITKGDRKMTEGRVTRVNPGEGALFIEGVTGQRLDGTATQVPIKAENTMITKLELGDGRRRRALERRGYATGEKGGRGEDG